MSTTSHLAALEEATETVAYKIYLSNTPNSYEEWSIWISNNLRLDGLLDVTTLGIPAALEIFKAGLLPPPAPSQPSTSGAGEKNSTPAPAAPAPTLSAKGAETLRLHALVLKSKDAKACRLINNSLHRNQMAVIKNCTSAFAMWQALYIHHSKGAEARFMQLVPVIFRSTFSRPGNFRSFVLNFTNAVEEVRNMGVVLPGFALAALLIHSLPPEWESIASSLTSEVTLSTDFQQFVALLYAQVDRRLASLAPSEDSSRHFGGPFPSSAFAAQRRDHSKLFCKNCNAHGHSDKWSGCPSKSNSESDKSKAMMVGLNQWSL